MRKRDMAVIAVLACTCLMLLSGCAKDINYIVDNEPCVRGIVSETSEDYIVIDVNEDDEIDNAPGALHVQCVGAHSLGSQTRGPDHIFPKMEIEHICCPADIIDPLPD